LNVGKEIEPKKLDLKPRASGRQIRQPLRSPLGPELRRFALWFFASTFLLSMLGCATRPVELSPRSSLSNQARQALRNSRSRTISDRQAGAWDLAAADLASRDLNDPAMVRTYNFACADFSERIYQTPISDLQEYHAGARSYRVHSQAAGKGTWARPTFKRSKLRARSIFGANAARVYARTKTDSLIKRALIFPSDSNVRRIIFMNTPHRGSQLAIGFVGRLAIRLIRLPVTVVKEVTYAIGDVVTEPAGGRLSIPTSIHGLSPKSESLLALDKLPIRAPDHSIIGDRGRGDTPNSSDGVVPYASSHLASAESELIVPGDHGSYRLPQANAELRRILFEHLRKKISPAKKGETKVASQALRKRQVDPQHGVRFD
jgi:hypothetical protein